jgi:hypothetical protein
MRDLETYEEVKARVQEADLIIFNIHGMKQEHNIMGL